MRWLKQTDKSKRKNGDQTLGTILKGVSDVSTYRYTKRGWELVGSEKNGKMVYSVALLGLIADKTF